MSYINFHAHTSFSDGFGTTRSLVQRAKDLKQPAYAITDHGTISGWIEFEQECVAADIKPIFGVEAYVELAGHIGHMTLLAKNKMGLNNIMSLVTLGHTRGEKFNHISFDSLVNSCEGVVILTGCPASPLLALLHDEEALKEAMHRLLAKTNVAIEIMPHAHMEDYVDRIAALLELFPGVPVIATNDIHYTKPSHAEAHMQIRRDIQGFEYDNQNLHNRSEGELLTDLKETYADRISELDITSAIPVTRRINKLIEPLSIKRDVYLPVDEAGTKEMIDHLTKQFFAIKYYAPKKSYTVRFVNEWKVIKDKGYIDYFYIVWQLVNYAKKQGIKTRIRGSGAGSLILYLLGISEVDPIRYGLLFERFLNETREDYPDVDIDVEHNRRHEIQEYAAERWGALPIPTKSRYKHKSLTRGIARSVEFPKSKTNIAADDYMSCEFIELMCTKSSQIAYDYGMGQVRHTGKHAGGIVMTDKWLPKERLSDGTLAVPWDVLEPMGLIKFDILGSIALSALKKMEQISGDEAPSFGDSPKVLATAARGDTLGVFQMSGDGIRSLAKSMNMSTHLDIPVALSLYRPGPLGSGMADEYGTLKDSPRLIHPSIDPILQETRGVIVYQEQMMQVFQAVTGLKAVEADNLRKIVSKKDIHNPKWEWYKAEFEDGAKMRLGMSSNEAETFWEEIASFDLYGFNKSHAVAYSFTTFQDIWYKVYYPHAFYTARLEFSPSHTMPLMFEAVEKGIKIRPPHVNVSSFEYETKKNSIFMPLTAVHRVGEVAANTIIQERQVHGDFKDMQDFENRVPPRKVNKGVKFALWAAGAFEGLGDAAITTFGLTASKVCVVKDQTHYERQIDHLKMVIPTKERMRLVEGLSPKIGRDYGVIDYLHKGENDKGKYVLITLRPSMRRYFFNVSSLDVVPGEFVEIKQGYYPKLIKH